VTVPGVKGVGNQRGIVVSHLLNYGLTFGNEDNDDHHLEVAETDTILFHHITPEVTGHSIWRRVGARIDNPRTANLTASWNARDDVFPDQYQLDHIIEIEGTAAGNDQGYSGWVELDDGRIFVVNYTDDTARWNCDTSFPPIGVSWIRGTYMLPSDRR